MPTESADSASSTGQGLALRALGDDNAVRPLPSSSSSQRITVLQHLSRPVKVARVDSALSHRSWRSRTRADDAMNASKSMTVPLRSRRIPNSRPYLSTTTFSWNDARLASSMTVVRSPVEEAAPVNACEKCCDHLFHATNAKDRSLSSVNFSAELSNISAPLKRSEGGRVQQDQRYGGMVKDSETLADRPLRPRSPGVSNVNLRIPSVDATLPHRRVSRYHELFQSMDETKPKAKPEGW